MSLLLDESLKKDMLAFLERTVNINSATKDAQSVTKVGEVVKDVLSGLDVKLTVKSRKGYGKLFLFESKQVKKGAPKTLLCGHTDIVITKDLSRPFTIKGDRLYGTGISDMKGGLAVATFAYKKLVEEGIPNIGLLLVPDEEVSSVGYASFLETVYSRYDYGLVFEKADKNENGKSTTKHFHLINRRKGVARYLLDVAGEYGHSGTVDKKKDRKSAIHELVLMLNDVMALEDYSKGTTINVGVVGGGVSANTIAPSARAQVDVRFTANSEDERVDKEIRKIAKKNYINGSKTVLDRDGYRPPMELNDKSKKLFDIAASVAEGMGVSVSSGRRSGASDANVMVRFGMGVLDGLGPYGEGDHDPVSYITTASLWQRLDFAVRFVEQIYS